MNCARLFCSSIVLCISNAHYICTNTYIIIVSRFHSLLEWHHSITSLENECVLVGWYFLYLNTNILWFSMVFYNILYIKNCWGKIQKKKKYYPNNLYYIIQYSYKFVCTYIPCIQQYNVWPKSELSHFPRINYILFCMVYANGYALYCFVCLYVLFLLFFRDHSRSTSVITPS